VRNDLAQCSTVGSIKVEELFEVYTFPYVHHLISTVKGTLKAHTSFNDIIKVTFPMGSMTGAPKLIVMQLIDEYEDSKRGLYAGTVGYVMPNGDFDFNVVIRSLQYHDDLALLRYHTGGAITYQSKAALEGEEVALKAKAMQQIFIQNNA
jgi:para-aminobenzoate synthetase component 1